MYGDISAKAAHMLSLPKVFLTKYFFLHVTLLSLMILSGPCSCLHLVGKDFGCYLYIILGQ